MLRHISYFFALLFVTLGIYLSYEHNSWQEQRWSTLTEHSGQIARELNWRNRLAADGSLIRNRFSRINFFLEGEHWEYSIIIPKDFDGNMQKMSALRSIKKGDLVELRYIDLDWSKEQKRRVWEIAKPDQEPILSVQEARQHSDEQSEDLYRGLILIGVVLLCFLLKTSGKAKAKRDTES